MPVPSYVGPPEGATAYGFSSGPCGPTVMNGGCGAPDRNVTVWNSPERRCHVTESPTLTLRLVGRNELAWTASSRVETPAVACQATGSAACAAGAIAATSSMPAAAPTARRPRIRAGVEGTCIGGDPFRNTATTPRHDLGARAGALCRKGQARRAGAGGGAVPGPAT